MTRAARSGAVGAVLIGGLLACSTTQPVGGDEAGPMQGGEGGGRSGTSGAAGGSAGAGGATGDGGGRAGGGAGTGSAGASTGTGTGGTSGAGSAGAGGAGKIDIADAPDPQTMARAEACSVVDLATVHGPCEESVAMGTERSCRDHVLYDQCTFFGFAFDDPAHAGPPTAVCNQECVVLESSPFWNGSCADCASTCPVPEPEVLVHELDTSDCMARPVTPCVADFATHQANLDMTLSGLLRSTPGADGELHSRALWLELKDGCVTRFYITSSDLALTRVSEVLTPALESARFECGQGLSCAHIQGPDTLATP